jgi:thiazole synthase ThiGH ThiG subunit
MASAPATSMPIRYHMTRSPLAGPCSAGSSTSTEYASSAMSWVADAIVMNSAIAPSIAAALAARARRPVAGSRSSTKPA